MGIYFVYINCKIVLGNVFILFIEMGCICIKKKIIMNYKIYKEVILFYSILILFYRKFVLNDKICLFESLGIMILIKNCIVLRKYVILFINICMYDLLNLIYSF